MQKSMGKRTVLNEADSRKILSEYGISVIEQVEVQNAREAVDASREIGFPVALKICSDLIIHKSDSGGVILNLQGADALKKAVSEMKKRFSDYPCSMLVQKMAPEGVELIIGARIDPVFGPVVLAGIGGVFAEVFRDTVVELAPVSLKLARDMIRRLRGHELLEGYRGSEHVDLNRAAQAIVSLSRLIIRKMDVAEVDINPLIVHVHGAVAVDALIIFDKPRIKKIYKRDGTGLLPFFEPSSVALIGASRNRAKGGNIILRNIQKAGFTGKLFPVNPSGQDILGMKSYKRITDIPEPVDLAMIVTPKEQVPGAVERCVKQGVKSIIISTGGYSDIGSDGSAEQKELTDFVKSSGVRLMGPNSIGTVCPASGIATSIVTLEKIKAGGVSLFGQSGVFSSGWARWIGDSEPFGLSRMACIGNKGDVDETDILEFLAKDDATSTIGMYLEGVTDGARFIEIASEAAQRKPVVVLKSGRTDAGVEAIASHTGSLAGEDVVFNAMCRRTGLVRVIDTEEFFDLLSAFEHLPLPQGNSMGVLSITGLGCVIATDAAEDYGVRLPPLKKKTLAQLRQVLPEWAPARNPVDIWSAIEQHGSPRTMQHISRCLIEQKDVDAILIIFVVMPESVFDVADIFGDIVREHPDKPVFASFYGGTRKELKYMQEGFKKIGVACYPTPERAMRAFSSMALYAKFRKSMGI